MTTMVGNGNDTTGKRPLRSADDPSNATPTLLTLPATDFAGPGGSKSSPQSAERRPSSDDGDDGNDDADRFVLLQLPPAKKGGGGNSLSVSDLMSGRARIVGPSAGDEDAVGGSRQACLVLEDRGVSFALSRVETSNALVLVPPAPAPLPRSGGASPAAMEAANGGRENDAEYSPPAGKKPRLDYGGRGGVGEATLLPPPTEMRARLLNPDGSGASFLDPRPHRLDRALLRRRLAEFEHNPYDVASGRGGPAGADDGPRKRGHSVAELALILRCSEREVRAALSSLGAFEMPPAPGSGRCYGTLSEEARMDATMAIVEALNECEEYARLFSSTGEAGEGGGAVEEEEFVERVVGRSKEGGAEVLEGSVVRHCLRSCAAAGNADEGKGCSSGKYPIDLNKIATFLGHHLFNQQSEPWEEQSFIVQWHKLIPGIGEESRPSTDLLLRAGVAIRAFKAVSSQMEECGDGDKTVETAHLSYFPESRLPMEPEERFRKIFRMRERWAKEDLEPYVIGLAEEHGSTIAEMLMKHARSITDKEGKQWYVAR